MRLRKMASLLAVISLLAGVLAACGGGGDGGGGGAANLDVLVINRNREAAATIMLAGGVEQEPVETCKAKNYTFADIVEPWQVLVNGEVAIDSATLEPNQIGVTLAAQVEVMRDGAVEQTDLRPGRPFVPPPTRGICF
jgi:hypothetical protein